MATRRELLGQLALGLGIVACRGVQAREVGSATFVAIETSARDVSRALFVSATGAILGQSPLDFRAHGMAEHGDTLVVFPRRPGDRFALIDKATLLVRGTVTAPGGRHFFGHGAFSRDGSTLIVPENDLGTLAGALAIYDVSRTPRRLGAVALPGAGPHEVIRMPESDMFLIALGGLETHPDYGRTPLNLHDFRSQILRYDLTHGTLDAMGHWAGSEGVSLRHMALDGAGQLYVGGQIPGDRGGEVLWRVSPDGIPAALPHGELVGGYVSSVAADGERALVTSKVTGRVLELEGDRLVRSQDLPGASAVGLKGDVKAQAGFTLLALGDDEHVPETGHEFDNHGLLY
ncbi:MAG: DUF1513 domain-containing protein [Pseudomonadota bacterium]